MNGQELERVLSLIDANVGANQIRLRSEILTFIQANEDNVLKQLREKKSAAIPTSAGSIILKLSDLEQLVTA